MRAFSIFTYVFLYIAVYQMPSYTYSVQMFTLQQEIRTFQFNNTAGLCIAGIRFLICTRTVATTTRPSVNDCSSSTSRSTATRRCPRAPFTLNEKYQILQSRHYNDQKSIYLQKLALVYK